MYRLRRDRTVCQILAKSNNPPLSYSELNIENFWGRPRLDFRVYRCAASANRWFTHLQNYIEIEQSAAESQRLED